MAREVTLRIAVPTYNRCEYLCDLLDSLEGQIERAGSACELVVYDNASPDATAAIVRERAARTPGIRLCSAPANCGGVGNIIRALTDPGVDYVWLVSDHMIVHPTAVARLHAHLEEVKPEAACAGIVDYGECRLLHYGKEVTVSQLSPAMVAPLYFHFSNISSVVVSRQLAAESAAAIAACGKLSYPHLGVWQHLVQRGRIGIVPALAEFSKKESRRGYAWFQSGVLDFGETVGLNFPPENRQPVLAALIEFRGFRSAILRYILEARAQLVREEVGPAQTRRFVRLYQCPMRVRFAAWLFGRIPILAAQVAVCYLRSSGPMALAHACRSAWKVRCRSRFNPEPPLAKFT